MKACNVCDAPMLPMAQATRNLCLSLCDVLRFVSAQNNHKRNPPVPEPRALDSGVAAEEESSIVLGGSISIGALLPALDAHFKLVSLEYAFWNVTPDGCAQLDRGRSICGIM